MRRIKVDKAGLAFAMQRVARVGCTTVRGQPGQQLLQADIRTELGGQPGKPVTARPLTHSASDADQHVWVTVKRIV